MLYFMQYHVILDSTITKLARSGEKYIMYMVFSHSYHIGDMFAYNNPTAVTFFNLCLLNTLRPRQNGRHFADDIFKCIFLNENVWISIKISLKFVPNDPINNIPSFVQIMALRRPGDKPLSEAMMVNLPTHVCVSRPQWVNHHTKWTSLPANSWNGLNNSPTRRFPAAANIESEKDIWTPSGVIKLSANRL